MSMKRLKLGISVCCAILGSAAILLSGMKHEDPAHAWQPLNNKLADAMKEDAEQELGKQTEHPASGSGKNSQGKERAAEGIKAGQPASQSAQPAQPDQMTQPTEQQPQALQSVKTGSISAPIEKQAPAQESISLPANTAPDLSGTTSVNAGASSDSKIHINTAQAAELMNIPGIGAKKAQAIIEYRNGHGPFKKVADLVKVKGIGPKMLEKMKPYIAL